MRESTHQSAMRARDFTSTIEASSTTTTDPLIHSPASIRAISPLTFIQGAPDASPAVDAAMVAVEVTRIPPTPGLRSVLKAV